MYNFETVLIGLLLALISILLVKNASRYYTSLIVHRTLSDIQRLLNPPIGSGHDLLASRAYPNERLIRAFALTNTFVSSEATVHTAFVGEAKRLLRDAIERGWPHFQSIVVSAVDEALPISDEKCFPAFIQDVTLRVALIAILGVDASVAELDSNDIRVVSTLITLLWSLSKKTHRIPPELLPQLNHHLRCLIPDVVQYPNPLDFVIPVWETLWRVVATTVAYAHNDPQSLHIFSQLHEIPTIEQFHASDEIHSSAEWFVTEAMRLHPPSKRITRANLFRPFRFISRALERLPITLLRHLLHRECADIGSILRSKCIWGSDADEFDAWRFHPRRSTPEQQNIKLLPFGQGRYRCVAASWAPMAAGIIAAAILDRLQTGSDHHLVRGKSIGGREGWEGWAICT